MRNYLRNIWIAICGFDVLEAARRDALREQKAKDDASYVSFQRLIENLRERVSEAEQQLRESDRIHRQEIAEMQADHKQQVEHLLETLQLTRLSLKQNAALEEDNFNLE